MFRKFICCVSHLPPTPLVASVATNTVDCDGDVDPGSSSHSGHSGRPQRLSSSAIAVDIEAVENSLSTDIESTLARRRSAMLCSSMVTADSLLCLFDRATGNVSRDLIEEVFTAVSSHKPLSCARRSSMPLQWIGQGSRGVVYRGTWHGAPVAIKYVVCPTVTALTRNATEAVLSKMLSHPNVLQTFRWSYSEVPDRCLLSLNGHRRFSLSNECLLATGAAYTSSGADSSAGEPSVPCVVQNEDSFISVGSYTAAESDTEQQALPILCALNAKPGQFLLSIVMEHCDCGSLLNQIRVGTFNYDNCRAAGLHALIWTAQEIARGMCHLHGLNIIHGDLKPENVLVRSSSVDKRGFTAKVADFGLAKLLFDTSRRPQKSDCGGHCSAAEGGRVAEDVAGTVAYMAPEVFRGEICKASDVFSFGVVLWQMCTGEQPYAGLNRVRVMVGVYDGSLALSWPSYVCPSIAKLGRKCLSHAFEQRPAFPKIASALDRIESWLASA